MIGWSVQDTDSREREYWQLKGSEIDVQSH